MKKLNILQLLVAGSFVVLLASCGPSRVYTYYPTRPAGSFSLILNGGPGIYATRYSDGRYFYRSPEGYTYWRAYDNRYYIDREYINRGHYDRHQYNEWNHYYNRHNRRHY